ELRNGRLDLRLEHLAEQIGPFGKRRNDKPFVGVGCHRFRWHQLSLASTAAILSGSILGGSIFARSTCNSMPKRLSRCPQPRLRASVNSSSVRLAKRIGTPTSLPRPTASETSLCNRRSAKSAGS